MEETGLRKQMHFYNLLYIHRFKYHFAGMGFWQKSLSVHCRTSWDIRKGTAGWKVKEELSATIPLSFVQRDGKDGSYPDTNSGNESESLLYRQATDTP